MSDAAVNLGLLQVSAVAGSALPIVAAVLKQDRLSQRANALIAAALALVVATAVAWLRHQLGLGSIVTSFTVMYTTAVAFYHGLWQPTGVAAAIQRRTSVWPAPTPTPAPAPTPAPPQPAYERADLARC